MTPHSLSRRVCTPRTLASRTGTFVVAAVLVGSAPLVAQALDEDPQPTTTDSVIGAPIDETPPPAVRGTKPVFLSIDEPTPTESGSAPDSATPTETGSAPDRAARTESEATSESAARTESESTPGSQTQPQPQPESDSESAAEAAVDRAIGVLTETYEWDEQSPRVEALQVLLGVAADGWYGAETAGAHRAALEFADLPTDELPVPVLPPGPSADEWAAMRECEAGGDYTITNPSGKYRGAYQFDQSTWDSVAGRNAPELVGADPAATAPASQDAMALALYRERGSAPWPQCGRHLS